jgi:hypothetical protein
MYIVFFQTKKMQGRRFYFAHICDNVEEAIEYRNALIERKTYNDEEVIYTSIKEGRI